jgi:hypothetical protein
MFPVITIPKKTKDSDAGKPPQELSLGAQIPGRDSRRFVNGMSLTVAIAVWIAGLIGTIVVGETMGRADLVPVVLLPAVFVGLYLLFAIKVVDQWEKAVILRFGRFRGLRGPGLFWIIPVVDVISHLVDQRVRATDVTAESALTRDTVPVNVDAIVFWLVWDAQKAVLEVQSYFNAIFLASQTALREAIGRHDLAEMITEREKLGQELAKILDEKTNPWGITVQSVEIRDVRIPAELEDAMSRRGARAAGPHHPRDGRDRDRHPVREGVGALPREPHRHAPACDEHAVRGDQGKGQHGDRPLVGGGDDGAGRDARHHGTRRRDATRPAEGLITGHAPARAQSHAFGGEAETGSDTPAVVTYRLLPR